MAEPMGLLTLPLMAPPLRTWKARSVGLGCTGGAVYQDVDVAEGWWDRHA